MPEPITHSFQAEVSQVLRLVIHSLYSHKEIFLRELVSNASDALDKLRFRTITEPDLFAGDTTLAIRIRTDRDRGTLTIEDTGIGMSADELIRDLGTVAHSGSRAFLEQLAKTGANKDARLIGQFGVGFYSAYLVADRVEVVSRAAGSEGASRWVSEGKDTFTIEPAERASRGTAITLFLREDQKEFLDDWRLRELIKRYSDYVSHPIQLEVTKGTGADAKTELEVVNRASALWQRPKAEITDAEYDEFFHHLAHAEEEKPLIRTHFKVEGSQEFAGLLYVPRERPFELRLGMKHRGVRLYVKRVLIMEDCEEIVPQWMRFVVGVIDSDDLPLNVSREILQDAPAVRTIKKQVVKHVLDALETTASEHPDDYALFWKTFGVFLKEGAASDFENRERLAKLLRYESTHGEGLTSLAEYVARMKEGQPAIYYAIGESRRMLEGAPHLEGLKKLGYEVLFMCDPIDQWTSESVRAFEGKNLVSAMRADLKIEEKEEDKKAREVVESAMKGLLDRARAVLGGRVKDVRFSDRLTDSPCCLVITGAGPHGYVQRLLREAGRDVPKSERILELNPSHPVLRNLETLIERGDGQANEWLELLYDQALLAEGAPLEDPAAFSRRMTAPPQQGDLGRLERRPGSRSGAGDDRRAALRTSLRHHHGPPGARRSGNRRVGGEEPGHDLARLPDPAFVERVRVVRDLGTDVHRACAPLHARDEARRRVDGAAASDGDEDVASAKGLRDVVERERDLAEPDNVGAHPRAARAARNRGVRDAVLERRAGALLATAPKELPVHVTDPRRAPFLVQVVDVLGAQEEPLAERALERGEPAVRSVGLARRRLRAALGIEPPDGLGVRGPAFRRGDLLEAVLLPEAPRVTKRPNAALGADPRPGEDEDALRGTDGERREGRMGSNGGHGRQGSHTPARRATASILTRSRCSRDRHSSTNAFNRASASSHCFEMTSRQRPASSSRSVSSVQTLSRPCRDVRTRPASARTRRCLVIA